MAGYPAPKTGVARALSKLGFCSRAEAWKLIEGGRVRLNGRLCREPEYRVDIERDRIEVDGQRIRRVDKVYVMLNKPRGLVTTRRDEKGRATVAECFEGQGLPFVSPVGRLDQASEGLLLFTNDTEWAAKITDPKSGIDKIYHVQVDCLASESLLSDIRAGASVDGDFLSAKRVRLLRAGSVNCWLEVTLDEGKNRHIRRLLGAFGVVVLRLIRISIGALALGDLPKGRFRRLTRQEVQSLSSAAQDHLPGDEHPVDQTQNDQSDPR